MHIFTKPCVKYQHLCINTLKTACFQLWDGEHKINLNVVKGYSISQHTITQTNTFTVCNSARIFSKLHSILSEMLKKAQRWSATDWPMKNYLPEISFHQ